MAETVGEGLILKVRGPCSAESTTAAAQTQIPGLRIPDGELRFELKFVSGIERASLGIILRSSDAPPRRLGYGFVLGPTVGAMVFRFAADGSRLLAMGPPPSPIAWDDWNTVALRVQGDGVWLIVNDVPIRYAADSAFGDGGVALTLLRSGNLNDEQESAVVLRNMRVSMLEGSDPSRAPVYDAPKPPEAPSGDEPPPLPPKPSYCNEIHWERTSSGRWILWCDQTNWNQ